MRMAEKLVDTTELGNSPIDTLRRADPDHLAKVIHSEHPQVVALVLCQLDTTAAARLLSALPAELSNSSVVSPSVGKQAIPKLNPS